MLLSESLKHETSHQHRQLEFQMQSHALFEPGLKKTRLGHHLVVLIHGHRTALADSAAHIYSESVFYPFLNCVEETKHALQTDLENLAIFESAELPPNDSNLYNSYCQAIGGLYVLLGSNLGRAFMAKKMEKQLFHFFRDGSAYFSTSVNTGAIWKSFKTTLDQTAFVNDEVEDVILGAKNTFSFFTDIALKTGKSKLFV
jgi:heme oxygenase